MQTALFQINENEHLDNAIDSVLSFVPFINYLEEREQAEDTVKTKFYRYILNAFDDYPELDHDLQPEDLPKYKPLLELVYAALSPVITNEKEYLWALSTPLPNQILYSTDAFHQFLKIKSKRLANDKSVRKSQVEYVYRLILKKLYNFNALSGSRGGYTYLDDATGLRKYYKIHADTTFIKVEAKGELPKLNFDEIESYLHEEDGIEIIAELLPLELFRFEGFSVITLENVTQQYAIENIRNIIISQTGDDKELYEQVITSLQTLVGTNDVGFGLLPFIKLNNKPIFSTVSCMQSKLINCANEYGMAEETFTALVNGYEEHPKTVFFSSITEEKQNKFAFLKAIKHAGVSSYAVVPVFYHKNLAGVLEVYSEKENIYFENIISRLEFAVPLIAQLLQNSIDHFNAAINEILKDKFTSLQPSVQWKFNEAAWNYLKCRQEQGEADIETVSFEHVYPFFGAIDIRNSTLERNRALQQDLSYVLTTLLNTLNALVKNLKAKLPQDLIINAKGWLDRIHEQVNTNDEIELSQFLHTDAGLFLEYYQSQHPEAADYTKDFLAYVSGEDKEVFCKNHLELERSIHIVNKSLVKYFNKAARQLQGEYPCYFEKFRTDGMEYDIYTGQALAPHQPFTSNDLQGIRTWQLRSMAEVARLTNNLLPKLPKPLQTTQLIFIHSQSIDISFRNDERRFDVEGAYNIRYEVIKKRIDKVCLKDTEERLTQPGKIAMVYFTDEEADEYTGYIQQLQQEGLLTSELEQLELEELQGVAGLKALRVSVNFN